MLKTLTLLNGASGLEDKISEVIIKEAKPYCDKILKDNMGNVYAFKKGTKSQKTVALFAHTDEVALFISDITPEGLLRFRDVGIDSSVLVGKRVTVGEKQVPGVIGARAVHLMDAKQKKEKLPINRLYIDIGALSKQEAETVVEKGDAAYFEGIWHETERMLFGKAFDDRAGCA
ncbi:MAG: M42 family peptidase, partial [Clostridia bacterium]|nr:M42 family peptidase [Clostridia bacterium]